MPSEVLLRTGRRSVRLTHPEKVLFPGDGITKADLAAYSRDIAPVMLPHARDRPLSVQRYNRGLAGGGFFQKDIGRGAPEWVRRVRVGKAGGSVCHPLANDAATLVWLANQNALGLHVWTSRVDRLDRPDRLVVDLDPSGEDEFPLVLRTALTARDVLTEAGVTPFAMTTGSRGLHVVVPLRRRYDFDAVLDSAAALARALVARAPAELTTAFHKDDRGGRLFVDVLRNRRAQTVITAYSVRARPGAPVAMPVRWEELESGAVRAAAQWSLRDALARVERDGDAWADIARAAGPLPRLDGA